MPGEVTKTLSDVKRMIDILGTVPEEKRDLVLAVTDAFAMGVNAGASIASPKPAAVESG